MSLNPEEIGAGYLVFTSDGEAEFGAVREIFPDSLLINIENAGDFRIPAEAVEAVHFKKVIVDCSKLDERVRAAIAHAHDAETGPE